MKFQNGSLGGTGDFCTIESTRERKKQALVVAGKQAYTGDLQDSQQFDTYICLRNKSTNKVQIVPVQQALLSNHIYQQLDRQKRKLPMLSREHANKKLLKEFGGRKASRFVDNHEKMLVNVDVVRQDLDETVKSAVQQEGEDDPLADISTSNEAYLATIVPKCYKTATDLDRIYDVWDLIPRALLERLDEEAKVVFSTPAQDLP